MTETNLEHVQSDTFRRLLSFKNSSGVSQSMVGYAFSGQIRTGYDGDLIATLAFDVTDAVNGNVVMSAPLVTHGSYRYSARWTTPAPELAVFTFLQDQLEVINAVIE
jgi:hypothetical protein